MVMRFLVVGCGSENQKPTTYNPKPENHFFQLSFKPTVLLYTGFSAVVSGSGMK